MSDEAVVRIVLDDSGVARSPASQPAPTRSADDQSKDARAYLRGDAMPWAPPGKPIQAPTLPGIRSDQAEYLRLESEAARAGKSVKDYKKAEISAAPKGGSPPPPVDTTGLAGLGKGIAGAMMANLYDGLFDALKQGKDKFAGVRDPVLAKAKAFFDQGLVNSAKDLQNLAQAGFDPKLAGLTTSGANKPTPAGLPQPVAAQRPPDVVPPPPPVATKPQTLPPPAPSIAGVDHSTNVIDNTARSAVGADVFDPTAQKATSGGTDDFHSKIAGSVAGRATSATSERAMYPEAQSHQPSVHATPAPSSFDPVAIAKKRVKAEEERAAVDAEYAKLKPPPPPKPDPPFDPVALAKSRVKAEQQREVVDAEYKKLKPKSALDSILDVVEDFRGTIGGTFGRVAGAALDITARLRKATTDGVTNKLPETAAPPLATVASDQTTTGAPPAIPVSSTGSAAEGAEALGEATGAAASKMAAIVPVAGAVAVAFTAAVAAFNAVVAEANKMVEKYGDYSPEIAQAQALAEVRAIMGDMRRAQQSGKDLAEFVRAQSEMQQKWEDLKVQLMSKIIPTLTGILEVLSSLLGVATQTNVESDEDKDPTTVLLRSPAYESTGGGRGVQFPEL